MNKISTRQLYFFLACVAPIGKLIVMPARLARYAGNDLWIPAAIQYLVQSAVIFCVLLLSARGETLFELLENTFGKIVAKILMVVFALFLLYASLLPLLEQKLFVQGVFYDTLPSLIAFSPFFLFSAYLCAKPLRAQGRAWDLLGPIAITALAGVFVFSGTNADFAAILPVGASGAKGILSGTAFTMSWFFDPVLLLLFLGKIEYKKGTAYKGALFYLLGGAAVIFFLIMFYGIFEGTAINQLFAFTKTSKYYTAITVLGRIDYVFIFALALALLFYCALPLQASVECCLQAFGRKKYLPTVLSVCFNALLLLLALLLDYHFGDATDAISQTVFWIFPVFTVVIPPLCLLLRRNRRESA